MTNFRMRSFISSETPEKKPKTQVINIVGNTCPFCGKVCKTAGGLDKHLGTATCKKRVKDTGEK